MLYVYVVWFVSQPKSKTIVIAGNSLELSCRAEASPGIKVDYSWCKCKKDGTDKTFVHHLGNRMTVSACSDANEGCYYCEAFAIVEQNNTFMINSNMAHVTVVNSAKISIIKEPPSKVHITFGQTLNLECEASCKNQPVKYQWYHKAEPVAGATQSTLSIPSISEKHVGSYCCEITSDFSTTSLKSRTTQVISRRILLAK